MFGGLDQRRHMDNPADGGFGAYRITLLKIFKGTVMIFLRCIHSQFHNFCTFWQMLWCRCVEHATRSLLNQKCQQNDCINPLGCGMKKHTCSLKYSEQCTLQPFWNLDPHKINPRGRLNIMMSYYRYQWKDSHHQDTWLKWVSSYLENGLYVKTGPSEPFTDWF